MNRPFPFVTLSFRALLLTLLAIDVTFILVNVLAVLAVDVSLLDHMPVWLKITEDRQPPEDFNYLKWLVIAVALLWMAIRDRWLAPVLWALVFGMILADDAFQVHENMGGVIAGMLEIPDNTLVYGRDFGELVVFGIIGTITLAIALFLITRKDLASRQLNKAYILIVIALGFCGVGIDLLHSMIVHLTGFSGAATMLQQFFGMVEDGGEMLVGSFAVAFTLAPPENLA
ncbi:MAG: hypothetical protein U1E58_03860 [Tabrizicola sp.]